MKNLFLIFVAAFAVSFSAKTQTLFSYGKKKTDVNEFLQAYNKLYPDGSVIPDREKSIREYLELYINSKLKIHEAYEKRYDTLPEFIDELNNLRQQVLENYLTDPESYNSLLEEAFARSQKDIHVQHIFIPFKTENGVSDSAAVKEKILEAHKELSAGKNFEDVALKYSADPAVSVNKGHLGFITLFSLPYQFENIVYGLASGKFSTPYRSNSGYHIFKNISERKAVGKIKVAHILLAVPSNSEEGIKLNNSKLADSLYQRLSKGDDFSLLVRAFSNDYISAASGGLLPEFSVGTYDPRFENAAFSIPADGDISKPVQTSHGYHIIKRIGISAPSAIKNKKALDDIKLILDKDPRVELTRDLLIQRIITKVGLKQFDINTDLLKVYTDSLADNKSVPAGNTLKNEMPLLKIGDVEKNIGDFVEFAQTNRWLPDLKGLKPFPQLMNEFKQLTVLDYYKKHLEEYNKNFHRQMIELKDGNLFFDIMMKEVWSKAQSDTVGQMNYYKQNLKKYIWTNSADAVIFYCVDEGAANNLRNAINTSPDKWKKFSEDYSDRSTYDSARFEISKIPGLKNTTVNPGTITDIEKNTDDNSTSFAYILKVYDQPAQKTFAEAKGDVITDFQEELDMRWINTLKNKYPVVIDQKVLSGILK